MNYDKFHYLNGREFYNRFEHLFPEELRERLQECLVNYVDPETVFDLEEANAMANYELDIADNKIYDYEKEIAYLQAQVDDLQNKIKVLTPNQT